MNTKSSVYIKTCNKKHVQCPYNANHLIERSKIHNHLNTCKEKKKSKIICYSCVKNKSNLFLGEKNFYNHIIECNKCSLNYNNKIKLNNNDSFIDSINNYSNTDISIDITINDKKNTIDSNLIVIEKANIDNSSISKINQDIEEKYSISNESSFNHEKKLNDETLMYL